MLPRTRSFVRPLVWTLRYSQLRFAKKKAAQTRIAAKAVRPMGSFLWAVLYMKMRCFGVTAFCRWTGGSTFVQAFRSMSISGRSFELWPTAMWQGLSRPSVRRPSTSWPRASRIVLPRNSSLRFAVNSARRIRRRKSSTSAALVLGYLMLSMKGSLSIPRNLRCSSHRPQVRSYFWKLASVLPYQMRS